MAESIRIRQDPRIRFPDSRLGAIQQAYSAGNSQVTLNDQLYNIQRSGGRGVFIYNLDPVQQQAPAPAPTPQPTQEDPIQQALDQLANIFKPPPPPPSPPAPVRASVDSRTTTVERRRSDFSTFAAATLPSGSDFSRRRPTLGAGI